MRGIRAAFQALASEFDRSSMSKTHAALRVVANELSSYLPPGYLVKLSLGQRFLPLAPWVAILDPDVTDSPLRGLYLVYLFSEDRETVYLSLIQGITEVGEHVGSFGEACRTALEIQRDTIRQALAPHLDQAWIVRPNLRSRGVRQRAYESASIAAVEYSVQDLPTDERLQADLTSMLKLYTLTSERVRALTRSPQSTVRLRLFEPAVQRLPERGEVRPATVAQYRAGIRGETQTEHRRRDAVLMEYASHLASSGITPSPGPDPIDLSFIEGNETCIVRLVVIRNANAAPGVRDAIGRLLECSYAYYETEGKPTPRMIALFSEPLGEFYAELLGRTGIEVIWKEERRWRHLGAQPPTGS